MNNYLANLAVRSVQRETPLQPRPLSLFEPRPAARMGALPVPIPLVVGEEGEAWETAVSPSPPTPSLVPPTVIPPQRVWQTTVQPSHMSPNPLPPTHGPEQPPASTTILREIERPETSVPAPFTVPPPPIFITTTLHAAAQQQLIQPAALPLVALPLSAAVHPQPATGDGRSPTPPLPQPITITPVQTIPATPPTSKPAIHNSQFTPSASSGQAVHNSRFLSQPPEPAPIIQVTIGRIEVRATPPPSAPREKRQSPSPTMNLDDYLRQRNGGQR